MLQSLKRSRLRLSSAHPPHGLCRFTCGLSTGFTGTCRAVWNLTGHDSEPFSPAADMHHLLNPESVTAHPIPKDLIRIESQRFTQGR